MPQWINANDRMPEKFGRYFSKVDAYKDILTLQELMVKQEKGYNVFWLDESDLQAKALDQMRKASSVDEMLKLRYENPEFKINSLSRQSSRADVLREINSGKAVSHNQIAYLETLFGVRKGKDIAKRIKGAVDK